jgi:hypothetical protein
MMPDCIKHAYEAFLDGGRVMGAYIGKVVDDGVEREVITLIGWYLIRILD